jgi:SAM-dependent methyltransferase
MQFSIMPTLWSQLTGRGKPTSGERWSDSERAVQTSFRLLLLRAPNDGELRERARALDTGQPWDELNKGLLGSAEFRRLYDGYSGSNELERNLSDIEREVLSAIGDGDNAELARAAYQCLLGREGDEAGLAHYTRSLDDGATRLSVVRALVHSDEFESRYQTICPQAGHIPLDVQLCELANPAKWDNPKWVSLLRSLQTIPDDKLSMHRKAYEFTQTLFGIERLGRLRDDTRVLSVAAGHECLLYWLANRVGYVVASDLYDSEWRAARAGEGNEDVTKKPEEFAPFPYRRERLVFSKMDGCKLAFRDGSFDVAYSLSSIEHFGGFEGARDAVEEMARVVCPGGLVAIATEYLLSGPRSHETFPPEEIRALATLPGLKLVEPIDERVPTRYDMAVVDLRTNPYQTPQMLVRDNDTVFTSVMMFLERV